MRRLVPLLAVVVLVGCAARFGKSVDYWPKPSPEDAPLVNLCLDLKPGKAMSYGVINWKRGETWPAEMGWCTPEMFRKDITSFFHLVCLDEKNRGRAGTEMGRSWDETAEDVFRYYFRPMRVRIYHPPYCPADSVVVRGEVMVRFGLPWQCYRWQKYFAPAMLMAAVIPIYPVIYFDRKAYALDDVEKWFQAIFSGEIEYEGRRVKAFISLPVGNDVVALDARISRIKDYPHGYECAGCSVYPIQICGEGSPMCRKAPKELREVCRRCRASKELIRISEIGRRLVKRKNPLAIRVRHSCWTMNTAYITGLRTAALAAKWFVLKRITGGSDPALEEMMRIEEITSPDNLVSPRSLRLYRKWWYPADWCPRIKKYPVISFDEWWSTRMRFYRQFLPDECYLTVEKKHSCWEYWTPEDFKKYSKPLPIDFKKKKRKETPPENPPAEGL